MMRYNYTALILKITANFLIERSSVGFSQRMYRLNVPARIGSRQFSMTRWRLIYAARFRFANTGSIALYSMKSLHPDPPKWTVLIFSFSVKNTALSLLPRRDDREIVKLSGR